ncbi:MAG: acetyltransferase [Fibrobacter sp.]|jgi:sugar O-acyltransferase (sialic acid O-acetyltransferase NeuD family)|nr:acetyltransferase [Fibrobacter sp.]
MRNLVIFGDTQFSERLCKYISFEKKDKVVAFTQEKKFITRKEILDIPVIPFEDLRSVLRDDFSLIIGIGYTQMNSLREKIYHLCKKNDYKVASYISSTAIVYTADENIGEGTLAFPGALIGPDCKLGVCNIIASGSVLSHDVRCGDFNFISANVVFGGFARIDNYCFIGLNVTIRDAIRVADRTMVGSAANVLKSIEEPERVVVGNPARCLENKNSMNTKI